MEISWGIHLDILYLPIKEHLMSTNAIEAEKPKRYHSALVALHWLVAILILSAFLLRPEDEGRGGFAAPQTGAPSIDAHMLLGAALLVSMIARVIVRATTKHPEWASTGNPLLDVVGKLTHIGIYVMIFSILIAGGFIAYQRGIIASVMGVGPTVAQGFDRGGGFSFAALHGPSFALLSLLILLHIGAALYHQIIVKDHLMARMGFGK